jgi:hypothetical protein
MSDSTESRFNVTDDGKLEKNEEYSPDFEEDLTFDE